MRAACCSVVSESSVDVNPMFATAFPIASRNSSTVGSGVGASGEDGDETAGLHPYGHGKVSFVATPGYRPVPPQIPHVGSLLSVLMSVASLSEGDRRALTGSRTNRFARPR